MTWHQELSAIPPKTQPIDNLTSHHIYPNQPNVYKLSIFPVDRHEDNPKFQLILRKTWAIFPEIVSVEKNKRNVWTNLPWLVEGLNSRVVDTDYQKRSTYPSSIPTKLYALLTTLIF